MWDSEHFILESVGVLSFPLPFGNGNVGVHLESGLTRTRAVKAGEIKDSSSQPWQLQPIFPTTHVSDSAEQKGWWKELRLIRFCWAKWHLTHIIQYLHMLLKLWVSKCRFSFPFAAWSILRPSNCLDVTSVGFFFKMPRDAYFYLLLLNHSLSSLLVPCPCDWRSRVKWGLHANSVLHEMTKLVSFPIIFIFAWQICQFKTGTELWPVAFLSCSLLGCSLSSFLFADKGLILA